MDEDERQQTRGRTQEGLQRSTLLAQHDVEVDIADGPSGSPFGVNQHSRGSSVRSLQDDEPIRVRYQDDEHQDSERIMYAQPSSPADVKKSSPLLGVSSLMRQMTTLRSPLSGRFPTIRRARRYENLDDGEDFGPGPVDISSLEGMGYELKDMDVPAMRNTVLEEEDTAYESPIASGSDKPNFRDFVSKRRSLVDGIGEGMAQVGAQLRRNPSKVAVRGPAARDDTAKAIDRHKTVRNFGQKLATEKNTIVEVNEDLVDLSQFEGPSTNPFRSSTASFDQMTNGNRASTISSITNQEKSYYFPNDPDVPNWKPFPMKTFYILILIALAITIAGIQEMLCQFSLRSPDSSPGLISFNSVADVATMKFFAWKYLPTMIAVAYSVLFTLSDFEIRRLEPYYQLSQVTGATAATSLNCDHLTMFQYFVPFKAFKLRQWAVLLSTTGNIIASMLSPAIQNPSLRFVENDDPSCQDNSLDPSGSCGNGQFRYWVKVDPIWSRLLSMSYLFIAMIATVLLFQLRRKSGLLSDPKGIAGIASMATKSHILRDFKGTDEASGPKLHKKLQHRRYVLYKSSIWQGEYSSSEDPMVESTSKTYSPQPPMLRKGAIYPFMAFMVFGLVTIPLISLTPARAVPNAAPWLPILLATLLKLIFNTFEADVRLMEPYYQLSRGNARPEVSLTLDYQASIYGIMPFQALARRHWLVMLVGISSVALDVFTVTIGSFSVNSVEFLHRGTGEQANQDETFVSFYVSLVLSLVILAFVLATTALVYARRRKPFLPREPSTIAANLAFIYSSNMLTDFIDTERLSNKQMEAKLKRIGKTYALGWFRGRDGEIHCAIDEEPILSRYVHGKSYARAQAAPSATFGEPDWEYVGRV